MCLDISTVVSEGSIAREHYTVKIQYSEEVYMLSLISDFMTSVTNGKSKILMEVDTHKPSFYRYFIPATIYNT